MTKPIVKEKSGFNPIWILPLVALLIGGWLLYRSIQDAGIEISVRFEDASGITPNKTRVMYKGIPVGVVRDLVVSRELKSVDVIIEMDKETKAGLVEDTAFWLVRPEISGGRVQGLDTLISGSYITAVPGVSKKASRRFIGRVGVPPIPDNAPGLHLVFETNALRSLQKNSTIFHRNVPVGQIRDYEMTEDGTIRIFGYIEPRYAGFVHAGTRFWNASGMTLKGDLTGLKLRMESLSTLLMGGIAFDTPEPLRDAPPVANGHVFHLYEDFDDAEYGLDLTLRLASGEGISEGSTKLMYQGLVAGTVRKVTINNDRHHSVTAHVLLDPRAELILRQGTRFWVVRPRVSPAGIEHMDTLLKGPYITFEPGDGPFRDTFDVEPEWEPYHKLRPGKRIVLRSADSSGLKPGSPIFFKKIQIGEIIRTDLKESSAGESIELPALIYDRYAHLVQSNTVFWNISGLDLKVRSTGVDLKMDSFRSLLIGGVAMSTPPTEGGKPRPAAEGTAFQLFPSYQAAVKATSGLAPPGLRISLEAPDPGSLRPESPVLFKKVRVGEVTAIHLSPGSEHVRIDVVIDKQYAEYVTEDSTFYMAGGVTVEGGLEGLTIKTESMESIIAGGIAFRNSGDGKPVGGGHIFPLYPDERSARLVGWERLTIRLPESQGLRPGAAIRYQGIRIGEVLKVELAEDLTGVIATAAVEKRTEDLFRTGTKIWVEGPRIGLGGVRNAGAVLTGPFLAVAPGAGEPARDFTVLDAPPDLRPDGPTLDLVLETARLGSLNKGAPVYYRQVKVGEVTGHSLADTADRVLVHVAIYRPYAPIIRENTKFWNASGLHAEAGLFSGVQIDTESLQALLTGGIALATPGNEAMGRTVNSGHRFQLYDSPEDEWKTWAPKIPLDLPEGEEATPQPVAQGL